jgi:hypothetical protein
MAEKALPPIHDTARLWSGDERATLRACIQYRENRRPGWTLSWLRESAAHVFGGELSEKVLKQAIDSNVPPKARSSVLKAVQLLIKFVRKYAWHGIEIPARDVPVGHGLTVRLRPVGMFFSTIHKKKCLLAIQPRLDDAPNYEQFRIWISALHYEFCCDPLDPLEALIVDLSRDELTNRRRLRELNPQNLPLLDKVELDKRLDSVATCYLRAIELIPEIARQPKPKVPGQTEMF